MNPQRRLDRRQFLQLSSAASISSFSSIGFAMGRTTSGVNGDDSAALYARAVGSHKGCSKHWITSLVKAGHPQDAGIRATKDQCDLGRIGMTVGGIACGTVYLAGDGRLFIWDIFNQPHEGVVAQHAPIPDGLENIAGGGATVRERDGATYLNPPTPELFPNPFRQHFEITTGGATRRFQSADWAKVEFDGTWPVGTVRYADPACPLRVKLSAWTPFIPLDLASSSVPVTVMDFVLENPGESAVQAEVAGLLENACFVLTKKTAPVELFSEVIRAEERTLIHHRGAAPQKAAQPRKDVVFEDFENGYGKWQSEGEAFGTAPVTGQTVSPYQGDLGIIGKAAANSHSTAPGETIDAKDAATGTLTSPEFTVSHRFIRMLVGGGNHPNETCVELLVDGKVVRSLTGKAENRMTPALMPVAEFEGRIARLRIADRKQGAWGNIGVDQIVFTDSDAALADLAQKEDAGTMALCFLGQAAADDSQEKLAAKVSVPAGGSVTVSFLLAWHFPNIHPLPGVGRRTRSYAKRFPDAAAVAEWTADHIESLRSSTMAWVRTYYDTTLPRWLMDRAAATTNTLQTQNCYLFEDGRFWAWEGVGCCPGTCTHVWHYAQGPARWFPEIERNLRLVTDFGVAQNPDGAIRFRAEEGGIAIDAQTGCVLRAWREHLCSADRSFLDQAWPGTKKAISWLLEFDRKDPDGLDGLLHGEQHNTLDAEWFGKVHALCSLYLAALRAAEEMARVVGEGDFADECRKVYRSGSAKISRLYNGQFFVQEEDPKHLNAIGVGTGCYIDQVIGQWWANQTGLGRLFDAAQIRSALHSLWRYNFVPNVGPFREIFKRGRFYAMPGDAGLVMCTWPKGGLRPDFTRHWQYGYFNECMSGFEHQVAGHMIQEGAPVSGEGFEWALENPKDPRSLTLRGLAVIRAVHDRYAPTRRNPYNEIECSDHYARAAASYSALLAVCGFNYDGPAGIMGFAPKIQPEDFRTPFTAAEGWGTYKQSRVDGKWAASFRVVHGKLRLKTVRMPWLTAAHNATQQGAAIPAAAARGSLTFTKDVSLSAGDELTIT